PIDTGRFVHIDHFQYPPPFLMLARAALWLGGDFAGLRALWFVLQALALGLGLGLMARFVGGAEGMRAALLSPLVWIALPTFIAFLRGNVHLAIVAMAALAMLAFERGHSAVGGVLLAFAGLVKI